MATSSIDATAGLDLDQGDSSNLNSCHKCLQQPFRTAGFSAFTVAKRASETTQSSHNCQSRNRLLHDSVAKALCLLAHIDRVVKLSLNNSRSGITPRCASSDQLCYYSRAFSLTFTEIHVKEIGSGIDIFPAF